MLSAPPSRINPKKSIPKGTSIRKHKNKRKSSKKNERQESHRGKVKGDLNEQISYLEPQGPDGKASAFDGLEEKVKGN